MLYKADLSYLMRQELPSIGYQKRLCYRTDYNEVENLYWLINKRVFDNKLEMPVIEVSPRCRNYWGICYGGHDYTHTTNSFCKIKLMDKWYCKQWLITTLAHEMCHQYQWDVLGDERELHGKDRLMSHGPSFYKFREKLAEQGISLKIAHSRRKWFETQDLFKS